METAKMQPRNLAFLLSEASGRRSRTIVTIANGSGKLAAGTVLGKVSVSGKFVPSPLASTDGSEGAETASAILGYGVDATNQEVEVTVIDRDAEVKGQMLVFDTTVDDQTKIEAKVAQLNAVGIRVR